MMFDIFFWASVVLCIFFLAVLVLETQFLGPRRDRLRAPLKGKVE